MILDFRVACLGRGEGASYFIRLTLPIMYVCIISCTLCSAIESESFFSGSYQRGKMPRYKQIEDTDGIIQIFLQDTGTRILGDQLARRHQRDGH